jgi:hypothetical protein
LPHQLEAVYDFFLKLPRIRFLLADDHGAGLKLTFGFEVPPESNVTRAQIEETPHRATLGLEENLER